jgi:predicted phosphodiesterase
MKDAGREILFCGDTHGRHAHVLEAAQRLRPIAVVLLGDMEFVQPAHLELAAIRDIVWWIHGNHDTDREVTWAHLMVEEFADRCIDGRVVTLPDGTRLAGLGGVFRAKIWAPPSPSVHASYDAWLASLQSGWPKRPTMHAGERLRHRSTIFEDGYDRLAAQGADILVTHEAPAPHRYGWPALNELARAMRVGQIFHGHQHDRPDYRAHWDRLGHEVHGVGLRGIAKRDGEVVVPGELDAARGPVRSSAW